MFSFEHTHQLSEAEYIGIWAALDPTKPAQYVRRGVIVLIGVACLFWSYTLVVGLGILAWALIHTVMPQLLPGTTARTFREMRYLKWPVTYGVDDHSLWVRTTDFSTKIGWHHVTVWRERQGWLILQGNGFPAVLLPIETLKAQGIYDPIRRLAQTHADMFGRHRNRRAAV